MLHMKGGKKQSESNRETFRFSLAAPKKELNIKQAKGNGGEKSFSHDP